MVTFNPSLLIIILIMLSMGLFGGIVNYYQNFDNEAGSRRKLWTCICVSIAASILVPLFLETISSNLLENCEKEAKKYFVLAGLCLVAAIFSRRFIDTIGKKILKEVSEVKEEAAEAKEKTELQQEVIDQFQQFMTKAPLIFEALEKKNEKSKEDDTTNK